MINALQLQEIIKRSSAELRRVRFEHGAFEHLFLKATTDDPLRLLRDGKTERPETQSES
jgi:hypothetical protein